MRCKVSPVQCLKSSHERWHPLHGKWKFCPHATIAPTADCLKVIFFYSNFTTQRLTSGQVARNQLRYSDEPRRRRRENSSPALVISVCFIGWSAGKPLRRAEQATKRERRRGNGANHLHRRRLDLITTLSALLPGGVSSSPLLAFEQQSRLTFSLLPKLLYVGHTFSST